MNERFELLVTAALIGLCIVVAAISVVPKVLARHVPIVIEEPEISVHVDGEVASPGVYRLPFRSRVGDALELAGGMTHLAEPSLVNLAAPLTPGERVHVPARVGSAGPERVSINSAGPAELQSLPGVGPVTAQAIISGRPYARVDDLLEVRGIGDKTLEQLRELVKP